MLIKLYKFEVSVDGHFEDQMRDALIDHKIPIIGKKCYYKNIFSRKEAIRVDFKCMADETEIRNLTEYLEHEFKGVALIIS